MSKNTNTGILHQTFFLTVLCFLWVCYIVDDVTDRPTLCAAFAGMKHHDSCICHKKPSSQNIFSELFVPIVEINSSYGYSIKKLPIPQRRNFMIEQLIAEATECDFKVALEIKKPGTLTLAKPKNLQKRLNSRFFSVKLLK